MAGLGVLQSRRALLPQQGRHPGLEPQAGLALRLCHGIQPHPAEGLLPVLHAGPGGDEGQPQAGDQQVLDPVRLLRRTADDGIPAAVRRCPVEPGEHLPRQLPAVRQLVDLGAQGVHAVEPPDVPLVGDAAQEAAGSPSPLAAPAAQLPGDDARRPAVRPLPVEGLPHRRHRVQLYLPCGLQVVVGPDVGGLVGVGVGLHLLRRCLGCSEVIKPSQVHIPVHRRRILGFDDVGRRAVHHGAVELRQHHAVQGVRVPGAP